MRISDWSSDVCSSDLEVRPQRQCPGDPDPLPLAAGKAVRVTVEVARVEPPERHQFMHGLRPTPGIADTVDHQRLADDIRDGHARIERAVGILEHVLNATPEIEPFTSGQSEPAQDTKSDV